MKNLLLLVIVLLAIGFFYYSKHNVPAVTYNVPAVTYEVKNDSVTISAKDKQFVFTKAEPFDIKGYVVEAHYSDDGPLSLLAGQYGIVWGDTAIELASAPQEKMKDLSFFSPEAQKVLQEHGCAAGYLNNHFMSIAAVTENAGVNKTLRDIKEGDIIDMKGYKVNIKSATFGGSPLNLDFPNTVCITEVSIKDNPAKK